MTQPPASPQQSPVWAQVILSGVLGAVVMAALLLGTFWYFSAPLTVSALVWIIVISIIGGIISVLVKVTL